MIESRDTSIVEARAALPLAGGVKCRQPTWAEDGGYRSVPTTESLAKRATRGKELKMKLKMKTTATLLIVTLTISLVAVSVGAGLVQDGDLFWGSKAKWSKDTAQIGDWSVHLNYEPIVPGSGEEGCIMIPVNLPLSELLSEPSTYWVNLIATVDTERPFDDYPYYPEIVLMIDVDGDRAYDHGGSGNDDYLFGEWAYYFTGEAGDGQYISAKNQWIEIDITDTNLLFWDRNAGIPENRIKGTDTLMNLAWYVENNDDGSESDTRPLTYDVPKNEILPKPDGVDITSESIVKYVMIQSWLGYEAYLDDVTMGGVLYELEPEQSETTMTVTPISPMNLYLTVGKGGTVAVQDFNSYADGTYTLPYVKGTLAVMAASPDADWKFAGFTGATSTGELTASVVMNADREVAATFVPKMISISVSPTSVNFGSTTIGFTSPIAPDITITNDGDYDVSVSLDLSVDSNALYAEGLTVNTLSKAYWPTFQIVLGEFDIASLELTVPSDTTPSETPYTGTLVFTATLPTPP